MKRTKKLLVLVVLFLALAPNVFSQDFVITSEGDTIKGIVSLVSNDALKIKTTEKKTVKLKSTQVKKVYTDRTIYLSREILKSGSTPKFVRIVDSGAVNLLTLDGGSSSGVRVSTGLYGGIGGISVGGGPQRSPSFYVEKSGEVTVLKDVITRLMAGENRRNEVIEILLDVMGDDPELAKRISASTKFTEKLIRDFVYEYNFYQKKP